MNLCIYGGEKMLSPEDLESEAQILYAEDARKELRERRNDVCKKCKRGESYQVICLENESRINYAMPVRVMEYEAGRYASQVRAIAAAHENGDYKDGSEFISGFTSEDRLFPVFTLILYWRREEWKGAKRLTDILDMTQKEKEIFAPYLQDCHLNLINMYELKGNENCCGQLKHILKLLEFDRDKKKLREEIRKNPVYRALKPETGRVLSVLLGDRKIETSVEDSVSLL